MKPHRIYITSAAFLILLLCFTPQSEGGSFWPLNKILGRPLCNKCGVDLQHPSTDLFCNNLQYDNTENFTPFCNQLNNGCHHDQIFNIHEKRCIFSKWNQYTDSSQRPPPLS